MEMKKSTVNPAHPLHFRLRTLVLKCRDLSCSPQKVLAEAHVLPGATVLDYGCGEGRFSIAAARFAGKDGKVYALDIHPLGLRQVQMAASRRGLWNVETICSGCGTGLVAGSVDTALLYVTLHGLDNPHPVLEELHRVLKPNGFLSFRDPHLGEEEILSCIAYRGFFRLAGKGRETYRFARVKKE